MGHTKKSTRKFNAKHLDRTIQQRRVIQNKKRKRGQDNNKHEHNGTDTHKQDGRDRKQTDGDDDEADEERPPTATKPQQGEEAEGEEDELDVDDFLSSGLIGDDGAEDDTTAPTQNDEDDEEAEAEETAEEAEERLLAEIEEHEAEMKALAKSDPAFYKHLQDNDAELLQFNKADIMSGRTQNDEEEDEEEEEEEEAVAGKKKKKAVKTRKAKTDMSLQQWRLLKRQVSTVHSISGLRKTLRLFRAACHANDEEKAGEDDTTAQLRFSSSTLFTDVIQFSVTQLPAVFTHHLTPTASTSSSSHRSLASHPKFKTVGPLLKTYLAAYIHLLSTQHDSKMIRLLLHTALNTLVPLFEPYPKLVLRLLKHLITLWSTADRSTRIDAFLTVRELCVQHGGRQGVLEEAMRAMYLTYVSYARFTSGSNVGVLEFMTNCIVELYGLDGPLAYQHAFVYIRQLAIHLRNATQGGKAAGGGKRGGGESERGEKRKSKKSGTDDVSYKAVYNWQFINCLRAWTRVLASPLAAQPAASTSAATVPTTPATLRPLLYPFVQVCLGVLTLLPSSRYHPLRLTVINFLITLSTSCHLYIPLVPSILSLFSSPELTRKPASMSAKSPDIRYLLKVSKTTSLTRGYQEQVTSAALRSLVHFYSLHSYSLAYPELMLVATRYLRRWVKQSKIGRLKKEMNAVVTQLEWNGQWSQQRREKLDCTPKQCVTGAVDAMYALRGAVGGGKEEVSPLERYVKLEKGEEEGGAVDWEGKERKGKKGTGDEEEDERDDEEGEEGEGAEDEEDEEDGDVEYDDDVDMDGDDVDDSDEVEEEEEPVRKAASKRQKATASKSVQAKKADQSSKKSRVSSSIDTADDDEGDIVTELVLSDDDD